MANGVVLVVERDPHFANTNTAPSPDWLYCAPSVSKSGSISNARGIWQKKYQHAFVTFQVPPAPESAATPTGEPRPPNAPQKPTRTQCYSGCTYCTCYAYLPNLLPTLVGRKPIQARVDTCLKAMNKSRQGGSGIDTVMELERRCDGKCNIQGCRVR